MLSLCLFLLKYHTPITLIVIRFNHFNVTHLLTQLQQFILFKHMIKTKKSLLSLAAIIFSFPWYQHVRMRKLCAIRMNRQSIAKLHFTSSRTNRNIRFSFVVSFILSQITGLCAFGLVLRPHIDQTPASCHQYPRHFSDSLQSTFLFIFWYQWHWIGDEMHELRTFVTKWWITAMLMQPSTESDFSGRCKQSHWKMLKPLWLHTFNKPWLRSQPIWIKQGVVKEECRIFFRKKLTFAIESFSDKYFPLPQPMSTTMLPLANDSIKFLTFGQGECRVSLKWLAISS